MSTDCNQYDEDELLRQLASGKQSAFEIIYNRYWKRLFISAANLLNNPEEAEECVQNVFISLWRRREHLQLKYTLHTYLTVAIKYQSLSAMARDQRRQECADIDNFADKLIDDFSPEADFISNELRKRIEQSINRLPPQCQLVFRMNREQDKTVKTIAESLKLSENTVKMHLKNANKKLRKDLLLYLFFISNTPFF